MNRLINQMKYFAELATQGRLSTKWGEIEGYEPKTYSVRVKLQPEEVVTAWIPLLSPWIGNGWGMICPPSVGDLCEVNFEAGNSNVAFACLRSFSKKQPPPQDSDIVDSGTLLLKSKAGAEIKLKADGSVEISSAGAVLLGDKNVTHDRLVKETFLSLYNGHTHDPSTGLPNPPLMDESHLTAVVKGN